MMGRKIMKIAALAAIAVVAFYMSNRYGFKAVIGLLLAEAAFAIFVGVNQKEAAEDFCQDLFDSLMSAAETEEEAELAIKMLAKALRMRKNRRNSMDNQQFYIIRAKDAGVFFGHIKERKGDEVTLTDCRRIWYWQGAASLSQLATEGVSEPRFCNLP